MSLETETSTGARGRARRKRSNSHKRRRDSLRHCALGYVRYCAAWRPIGQAIAIRRGARDPEQTAGTTRNCKRAGSPGTTVGIMDDAGMQRPGLKLMK